MHCASCAYVIEKTLLKEKGVKSCQVNYATEKLKIDFDEFTKGSVRLIFDLLEHEIQHHGQPIRYIYGNNLEFPKTWNDRYTV